MLLVYAVLQASPVVTALGEWFQLRKLRSSPIESRAASWSRMK
jgi:hypothetical protein